MGEMSHHYGPEGKWAEDCLPRNRSMLFIKKKINKAAKSLFNLNEDSNIRIKWGYATSLLSFWKGKKYYIGIENCFLSSAATDGVM